MKIQQRSKELIDLSKYNTLGELLRDLRKKTRLTQVDIASKVDSSDSYLSKLETDKIEPEKGPSPKLLKRLARVLSELNGVSYESLYDRMMELAGKETLKIAEDLSKENPTKLKVIKGIIDELKRTSLPPEEISEWKQVLRIKRESRKIYEREIK